MKPEKSTKDFVRRREKKALGIFIDGIGLDRATRRLKRRVDLKNLLRGVSSGLCPIVARYYTLLPYEDDSRQHAFLDAVTKAGFEPVVKRLPPKSIAKQVTIEVEMAADIMAFALGRNKLSTPEFPLSHGETKGDQNAGGVLPRNPQAQPSEKTTTSSPEKDQGPPDEKRIVTVVCPGKDLRYVLGLAGECGADTVSADFGKFSGKDVLKSAAKWIDLSDSETIWRDS